MVAALHEHCWLLKIRRSESSVLRKSTYKYKHQAGHESIIFWLCILGKTCLLKTFPFNGYHCYFRYFQDVPRLVTITSPEIHGNSEMCNANSMNMQHAHPTKSTNSGTVLQLARLHQGGISLFGSDHIPQLA